MSSWIIDHIPDHHLYVEAFGGAASILANKERSPVEVYNDLNGHCVEFFEVVKNHGDELAEWVDSTPYSRELFDQWADEFLEDNLPDDIVERAGRFYYIQQSSFGGLPPTVRPPNWAVTKVDGRPQDCRSKRWSRAPESIDWLKSRFKKVQIERSDYRDILDRYDDPKTFFYLDPPYVDIDQTMYDIGDDFDHDEFVEILHGLESNWMLSYDDLPAGLGEYYLSVRGREWGLNRVADRDCSTGTEKLVMNYDPDTVAKFSGPEQATLTGSGIRQNP